MKGAPTTDDELATLRRGLDRHRRLRRKFEKRWANVGLLDPNSKRPRHSGEEGEAESSGPERGRVSGPVCANSNPED